jgi:hypothetical protein
MLKQAQAFRAEINVHIRLRRDGADPGLRMWHHRPDAGDRGADGDAE